jgi:hypothetical protein
MTPLEHKLMAIAFRDTPAGIKAIVLEQFEDERLYVPGNLEWQTYVDEDVRALWGKLDFGQKLIAYIAGRNQAEDVDDRGLR